MSNNRRAGILYIKIDGQVYDAKGNFTYNLGSNKRETIKGADRVHGFTEKVQAPFIEGEITDNANLDVAALTKIADATVTLELATGKVIVLRSAWYAADGDVKTEEGNIQARFEGLSCEEVRS